MGGKRIVSLDHSIHGRPRYPSGYLRPVQSIPGRLASLAGAEFDRRMAAADRPLKLTVVRLKLTAWKNSGRIVANASREVGRLGDRWGTFVENLVEPAVLRLFQERGIDIQTTLPSGEVNPSASPYGNRHSGR
jgi:hypothetical protein